MDSGFFMQNKANSGSSGPRHWRAGDAGSRHANKLGPRWIGWTRLTRNLDVGGQPGFPGARKWLAPSALSADFVGRMGVKRPEMGSKWRFLGESATWIITAQLLFQDIVKSKVASHESPEGNSRTSIPYTNLRRKLSSQNFCRNRKT